MNTIPTLFETESGIATGHAKPYCSTACLESDLQQLSGSFQAGHSSKHAFGFTPQCERCGKFCDESEKP